MAIVPVYEEKVGVDAPGVPNSQIGEITPAASGVGIAEASAKLGQSVEQIGNQLGKHLAYLARMERQQQAYDIGSQYARQGNLSLHGDGTKDNPGILSLKGHDARNALAMWQARDAELRKSLIPKGLAPDELRNITRSMDLHGTVFFDNALHHQRIETEKAQQESRGAAKQALQDTASLPNTTQDKFLGFIKEAQGINREMHPGQDEQTNTALDQKEAASMMSNFMKANLEDDPQKVADMLEAAKPTMHASDYGLIKKQVDGKMIEIRSGAVWDQVKDFQHDDGTIDIAKAESHAKQLASTLPPGEQQHVVDFVKKQAAIADAALKDARAAQNRSFIDDAMKAKANGISYEQAHEALFKDKGYGFDPKDIQDKTDQLRKLYTHDDSFFDYAQQHQSAEQRNAWSWVEKVATAGMSKEDAAAFIVTEKKKWMGRSADQIRAGAADDLKKQDLPGGHWWNFKVPGWKIDADVTQANAEKIGVLEKQYPGQVSIAKAFLDSHGKLSGPDEVAAYLALVHKK